MKKNYTSLLAILIAICSSTLMYSQNFSEGVLILNEGLFGSTTASVSHLDTNGNIINSVFSSQNGGADLGDTAQGLGFEGDFAYLVLNGSNAVRVVNRINFELVTTITDQMENPRNIAFADGKGYVTNWGDGLDVGDDYVAVIDLATNTVTETISVVEGPEEILAQDGILYVAHQGGFGFGNTISIIDTSDNSIESIQVGDVPSAIRIDSDNLYVLSSGNPDFSGNETPGSISIINLDDFSDATEYTFPGLEHPAFLGVDETDLYYTLGVNIFKMELSATTLPTDPFIETASQNVITPYSLNKIGDKIYLGDALNFVSDGMLFIYNEDGTFDTDYPVGLLPNGIYNAGEVPLNIDSFSQTALQLYPNPATTFLNINTSETVDITIMDISGRMVKQIKSHGQPISLAGIHSGMYVVLLKQNGIQSTQKLIIK